MSALVAANIPAELRARRQWVCWNLEPRAGQPKPAKMPYTITGGHASTTNPATWATFDEAVAYAAKRGWSGVGFVFSKSDDYVGLDFDGLAWAEVAPLVRHILPAYTEVSQSGHGIHVICKGKLPPGARRKGQIECYEEGRFFAITGVSPDGDLPVGVLEDRTEALAAFHAQHLGGFVEPGQAPAPSALGTADQELLDRILREPKDGRRFHGLYAGGDHNPHKRSEADFDLAEILCRHTADNEQVKRIILASALRREKWAEHRTLVDITVRNARLRNPGPVAANGKPRWELLTSGQFMNLPKPKWLVESALVQGCLTLLYGMKGSYKSFVSYALAAAIATNTAWLGKYAVKPGVVVYVVAEGQGYFGDRIDAAGQPPNIRHVTVPVNLFHGEAADFAACVRAQLGDVRPALLVFDTLARSMVGGEENSNTDMGVVVDAAGMLQREFTAAVLLVHHTGKDGLTSRGGYALECAADIILRLEKTGPKTVTLVFQNEKFIEEPPDQGLRLVPHKQSLIVEAADAVLAPTSADRYTKKVTGQRQDICDAIGQREVTAEEIALAVGRPAKRVREELNVLTAGDRARVLVVGGTGKRGSPLVYALRDPVAHSAGL